MPANRKNNPPLVSFAEASRIVGIARQNIPGAIARGDLRSVIDQMGKPRVTRASALLYRKRRDAERDQRAAPMRASA